MMKTLLAVAVVAALLTATGCCLPLHHGRYGGRSYYSPQWSDSSRPAPPARPSQHRPGGY